MAIILVADDHALVRDAICHFLSQRAGHIVHAGGCVADVEAMIEDGIAPDLILLDYRMPGMHDLMGLDRLRVLVPGVPLALISGTAGSAVGLAARERGAVGFLPKTLTPDEMTDAIGLLLAGGSYIPPGPEDGQPDAMLTRREFDVLRGVANGQSNKEIARSLNLSEVTIKLHVKTMCRKLDARNRTHAAMLALEMGLL